MREATIRAAGPADAFAIARLANALNAHEGKPPDLYSADSVLRDGFGDDPAFRVLLAERDGEAVGYALFHPAYNSELAARGLWLTDVFVVEAARGGGVGHRLLAAVARVARDEGRASVWWGVRSDNAAARAFYARLGARDEDARILELDGAALASLAGEA